MNRRLKTSLLLLLATVISTAGLTWLSSNKAADAANPTTMSFQGKVVNANGTNVADGTYTFTFKIYSAGVFEWGEIQSTVNVTAGVFQVNLGSVCGLTTVATCSGFSNLGLNFSTMNNLALGITFNNDAAGEMTPRVPLQSVPYAYQADNASSLGGLAASNYAQLSPGSQQTGFLSVNGNGTFGGTLSVGAGTSTVAGSLSVGTATAPTTKLDVLAANDGVRVFSNAAGSYTYLALNRTGASTTEALVGLAAATNDFVTGSAAGDMVSRVLGGNLVFATSATSIALKIDSANAATFNSTVSGTTLNGTTGLNTGASAGTKRIDSSGNLVNIGNITGIGAVIIQPAAATALTITGHAASTFSTDAGVLTLQGGSGTVSLGTSTILTAAGTLAISAGGAAQNLSLDGSTTGQVLIGGTSTGNVLIGGGSASTGCTVTNLTGALACSNALTISAGGAAITGASTIAGTLGSITTLTAATINATTAFQANGTPGVATLTCTGGQTAGVTSVRQGIATVATCTGISDSRVKENITALDNSVLDSLNQIQAVHFNFKCQDPTLVAQFGFDCSQQTGVIAQQLATVFPDLVTTADDGYLRVNYQNLGIYTLKGVQELSQHLDAQGNANLNVVTANNLTVSGNLQVNGSLTYSSFSAPTGDFSSSVISPHLTANGALVINSGSSGDVTLDSGGSGAAVNIGDSMASGVNISRIGATTSIKGAIAVDGSTDFASAVTMHFTKPETTFKIDNNGSTTAVDSAIQITDSSGSGYGKLISTPNFSVGGSGDITTAGSVISKGGSFQLLDPVGGQLISFDQAGNGSFKGNLNLASASLSGGLSVGGDATFAGLSTFQKLATFLGKTIFRQDVQFDGHLTVARDGAGYASLRTGETMVHVSFTNDYAAAPIVSATITNGLFGGYTIDHVTASGFDIVLQQAAAANISFSWTAIGVNDPQTASNPPPATP